MTPIERARVAFAKNGEVNSPWKAAEPMCTLRVASAEEANELSTTVGVPFDELHATDDGITVEFQGCNALDFLGAVCPTHYRFNRWLLYRPDVFMRNIPDCLVTLTDPRAVLPSKVRASDAGYDLTIISEVKRFNKKTVLYDTGIKIKLPHAMYAEVVPRSSLSKSGYVLANSVGIIDNSYRGNIYVALCKVDEDAPDIELPFRCCQLIFRQQVFVDIVRHDGLALQTARGENGYGSTGGASASATNTSS
jgi:deoxyuridine 5'-triphosphate nucleotidohydrolase